MTFRWPAEDGWPYPDPTGDLIDLESDLDEELLSVTADSHLLDGLDPLEREVVCSRFGLAGYRVRSIKQLHHELGLPHADIKGALGSGLQKIRLHLTS